MVVKLNPGSRKANAGLLRRMFAARYIYAALFPSFFLLSLFSLYPAINAIEKSFFRWKPVNLFNPVFIGLDNYRELFRDGEFWSSFLILLVFIVWGFINTVGICLTATYLVHKLGGGRWGKFVQRGYIFPMLVPSMVITLFWRLFYDNNYGMLNNFLRVIGLDAWTHIWLGEKMTALPSLLFMGFPWIGGFAFLVFLAGFQGVDQSLHESVQLEGANALQTYWYIDLPLIIPQIKIIVMLGMISGLQQYATQMIMTNGGPDGATMVPGLVMYKTAFTYGNYGYGCTLGVALFVIILAITVINNKYIQTRT